MIGNDSGPATPGEDYPARSDDNNEDINGRHDAHGHARRDPLCELAWLEHKDEVRRAAVSARESDRDAIAILEELGGVRMKTGPFRTIITPEHRLKEYLGREVMDLVPLAACQRLLVLVKGAKRFDVITVDLDGFLRHLASLS